MLARWTAFTILLALTACGTPALSPEISTPSGRVDRVVLAPLNLSLRMPAEVEGTEAPVWQALLEHFQSRDRVVRTIDERDARALWSEIVLQMGDDRNLEGATRLFATRLAEQSEFDLLVIPALVMRTADVRGNHVYWDGVRRKLDRSQDAARQMDELGTGSFGSRVSGLNGRLAGASLYVAVVTSAGEQVYAGMGGLDLLHEVEPPSDSSKSWRVVLREDPFRSADHLREGVSLAMERRIRRTASAW